MSLCETLFGGVEGAHVAIAAVAQVLLSWIWFEVLFVSFYAYYSAADKGLRRTEHIRKIYPAVLSTLATFGASVVRALAIFAIVKNAGLSTRQEYLEAANMVTAVVTLSLHRALWSQRPGWLIFINGGYELVAGLVGATVLHALAGTRFF